MQLDQSSMDISTLVDKVRSGQLDLQPDFQRGQVWTDGKKRRLIDTILRRWYIPAVHIVVNDELDKEEVLDGQQRLRTIIEFMDDQFVVDGKTNPYNHDVAALDGYHYSFLPDAVKSRFKRFTITTVRLREYEPEEPGELFFRLNQLTALTAAEQRNALIGEARNQVRVLSDRLSSLFPGSMLGFSNSRLNFDDVLSRLAIVLEERDLSTKVTSSSLETRYRKPYGFSDSVVSSMDEAISIFHEIASGPFVWRQNKATLFSWLYFICSEDFKGSFKTLRSQVLRTFFNYFEATREKGHRATASEMGGELYTYASYLQSRPEMQLAARIFNDRSSSRVNDASSIVLRDAMLHSVAYTTTLLSLTPSLDIANYEKAHIVLEILHKAASSQLNQADAEQEIFRLWEQNVEVRANR